MREYLKVIYDGTETLVPTKNTLDDALNYIYYCKGDNTDISGIQNQIEALATSNTSCINLKIIGSLNITSTISIDAKTCRELQLDFSNCNVSISSLSSDTDDTRGIFDVTSNLQKLQIVGLKPVFSATAKTKITSVVINTSASLESIQLKNSTFDLTADLYLINNINNVDVIYPSTLNCLIDDCVISSTNDKKLDLFPLLDSSQKVYVYITNSICNTANTTSTLQEFNVSDSYISLYTIFSNKISIESSTINKISKFSHSKETVINNCSLVNISANIDIVYTTDNSNSNFVLSNCLVSGINLSFTNSIDTSQDKQKTLNIVVNDCYINVSTRFIDTSSIAAANNTIYLSIDIKDCKFDLSISTSFNLFNIQNFKYVDVNIINSIFTTKNYTATTVLNFLIVYLQGHSSSYVGVKNVEFNSCIFLNNSYIQFVIINSDNLLCYSISVKVTSCYFDIGKYTKNLIDMNQKANNYLFINIDLCYFKIQMYMASYIVDIKYPYSTQNITVSRVNFINCYIYNDIVLSASESQKQILGILKIDGDLTNYICDIRCIIDNCVFHIFYSLSSAQDCTYSIILSDHIAPKLIVKNCTINIKSSDSTNNLMTILLIDCHTHDTNTTLDYSYDVIFDNNIVNISYGSVEDKEATTYFECCIIKCWLENKFNIKLTNNKISVVFDTNNINVFDKFAVVKHMIGSTSSSYSNSKTSMYIMIEGCNILCTSLNNSIRHTMAVVDVDKNDGSSVDYDYNYYIDFNILNSQINFLQSLADNTDCCIYKFLQYYSSQNYRQGNNQYFSFKNSTFKLPSTQLIQGKKIIVEDCRFNTTNLYGDTNTTSITPSKSTSYIFYVYQSAASVSAKSGLIKMLGNTFNSNSTLTVDSQAIDVTKGLTSSIGKAYYYIPAYANNITGDI